VGKNEKITFTEFMIYQMCEENRKEKTLLNQKEMLDANIDNIFSVEASANNNLCSRKIIPRN